MTLQKRKRSVEDEEDSDFSVVQADDDIDIDISSALTGKPARKGPLTGPNTDDDDDDELQEFIHDSIAKRNVKGGTEMLKKIKNKGKGKGDVGGGSFQSMGVYHLIIRQRLSDNFQVSTRLYFVH
jgi:ATP-dependent RNA helicase DDX54/DBP10